MQIEGSRLSPPVLSLRRVLQGCRLTQKLVSPRFPRQKASGIFTIGFWIIAENMLCGKHTKFIIPTRSPQGQS